MNILIESSSKFNDYPDFMRSMMVALSDGDEEINLLCYKSHKLYSMALEFANVTEQSLKSRGIKLKVNRVADQQLDNLKLNKMFYFCTPGEHLSPLAKKISNSGQEVVKFVY